jgi:predicted permease
MRGGLELLRRRLGALLNRRALEQDMDEEMRLHVELEAAELARTGFPADEALRRARIAFGGVERFKEEAREARSGQAMERMLRELRLSLRTLRRSPGFTLTVLLTITLGIGASTALFTVLNRIVLQPLPYPASERLVRVTHDTPGMPDAGLSSGTYLYYRDRASSFQSLASYHETVLNLASGEGSAERVRVAMTGPELFDVLGVRPVLGRAYTVADAQESFTDLNWTIPVLLGHELWQRRFGGDSAVVGRIIRINDRPREVVGILPPRIEFPEPRTQVWMLFMPEPAFATLDGPGDGAVGRLRPGVSPEAAEAELRALLPSIAGRFRDATPDRLAELRLMPRVTTLRTVVVGDHATVLWALFGGMLILLFVAMVNVANLFLVRSGYSGREIAVRRALGARPVDVARLFFVEGSILTLAGAVLGLSLAGAAIALLVDAAPVELPRLNEVRLDGWSVLFAAIVAAAAMLTLGAPGTLYQPRATSMHQPIRSAGTVGHGRAARRTRDTLMLAQVALALTLLTCAALAVQSAARLTHVDHGFDETGLLTVEIGLPYANAGRHRAIYLGLLERLRAIPGVADAAVASDIPLTGLWGNSYPVLAADGSIRAPVDAGPPTSLVFHSQGYLAAMGTRVIDGAATTARTPPAQHPVLVSAALAHRLFGDAGSVGRRILRIGENGDIDPRQPAFTIVGVVEDVRERSLADAPAEVVYVPLLEQPVDPWIVPTEMTLVLRSTLPADALTAAVRRAIVGYDPSLSVARVRSMETIVDASTARATFLALLLLAASMATLFVGTVGIWGVVAYTVRQRTAEIGLRLVLGAPRSGVTALVMRQTLAITLLGAVVGIVLSLAAAHALRALLFGVSPSDPLTMVTCTCALIVVGLVAGYLPARRAARVNPLLALNGG